MALRLAFVSLTLLLATPAVSAAGWETYGGNYERTGIHDAPTTSLGSWSVEHWWPGIGEFPTPILSGDTVYFATPEAVSALDAATGVARWTVEIGETHGDIAYTDGKLFVVEDQGVVSALDARSGATLWEQRFDRHTRAAPAISQGIMVVTAGWDGTGSVRAFAVEDGAFLWEVELDAEVRASPSIGGGGVIVMDEERRAHLLDLLSGQLLWTFDGGAARGYLFLPVHRPGVWYLGVGHAVVALNASDGSILWSQDVAAATALSSVGDHVIASGLETVTALDGMTGREIWRFKLGDLVHHVPAIYEDRVYVGAFDGTLYVLDLHDGRLLHSLRPDGHNPARLIVHQERALVYTSLFVHGNETTGLRFHHTLTVVDVSTPPGRSIPTSTAAIPMALVLTAVATRRLGRP